MQHYVSAILIVTSTLLSQAWGSCTELFISEYIEGSSNNKALEIFNPTGTDINLSHYTLERYTNGSTTVTDSYALSGNLAAGDVYVIAYPTADAALLAVADATDNVIYHNGDDAMILKNGGIIIDAIGRIGEDPGTEWGEGDQSTADNTLVRSASVTTGDTNGTDAFDPAAEWDGYATDTFSHLGTHTFDGCDGNVSQSTPVWQDHAIFRNDTDSDGIPDEWEQLMFGNLTTADTVSDMDHDGYSDLAEFNRFLAQSDPYAAESSLTEARRRMQPVLETLDIPEQMLSGQTYTLSWKLLGYDSGYTTVIAFFDCTGTSSGACGSAFGSAFHYYVADTPTLAEDAPWSYNGESADYFTYTYDFPVPEIRNDGSDWASSGTDIVVRFYQKTRDDADAGKGSISLLIPGNVTDRYYDATGRRILKTICPSGGCSE